MGFVCLLPRCTVKCTNHESTAWWGLMFIKTAFLLSSTLGFWEGRAFSGFGIFEVIHLAVKKIRFLVDGLFIPQDMAYNHHHSPSFSVVFCIDLIGLRGHCHFILLDISSFIRFFVLSFLLNDFFSIFKYRNTT